MPKVYGTAIRPEMHTENQLEELTTHLGWSKVEVIGYCVATSYAGLMSLPKAMTPQDMLNGS